MKFYSTNSFQIGDIQAFKKMLADAIRDKKSHHNLHARESVKNFTYNDEYYSHNLKDLMDRVDS